MIAIFVFLCSHKYNIIFKSFIKIMGKYFILMQRINYPKLKDINYKI